jgi:hypothetical protein
MGNWRKSTWCGSAACVEVDTESGPVVRVRDSKPDAGPDVLAFSPGAWRGLIQAVRSGDMERTETA